jgi:tRNA 5-methylaminomethyl-2-thiouridine biosynthesis bifunctional protein
VLERRDGTPFSPQFDDIYHPAEGGLAQARHVFLGGNGIPGRWHGRETFVVLETGFGLGLNFLATWLAWRADPQRCARLHFVSVEKHPFEVRDLRAALAPFEELRDLADALVAEWPPLIAGFHRFHFDDDRVTLTLAFGNAREALEELDARADAFYLDGFAPARNPEMWSPEVVREIARLAQPGATLATWTVAGGVRAVLADAGFRVEKRPGFGSKREMLCGVRDGMPEDARIDRRAVVVGAGLAGTLVAERLAVRGWHVTLVDAREERSAPAVGLVRPIVNPRDALNAQLSRSAFLYAVRRYERMLSASGWRACGVLQLAQNADSEVRFAAVAQSQGYPAQLLEYVHRDRACEIAGRAVTHGGWWIARGGAIPVAALTTGAGERSLGIVRRAQGRRVERVEREAREWRALDAGERIVAEAPVLVLANAMDARRLLPAAALRLAPVRGQLTYLPADPARKLDVVVSGNGYVAPLPQGGHAAGASYLHDDPEAAPRVSEHHDNLARAESMLPGFTAGLDAYALAGWVGFRATVPDRLPVYGATSVEGVYAATGLGSRGLLWAALGAELLASLLSREPIPLPRTFAAAVSPLRFGGSPPDLG